MRTFGACLYNLNSGHIYCEFSEIIEFEYICDNYLILYFRNEGEVRINVKNVGFKLYGEE